MKELSIIIPVYNEEDAIGNSLAELSQALTKSEFIFEIVAVNDGSTDGSGTILEAQTRILDNLRVVSHSRNRGYGAALKTGIKSALYGMIAIVDADGTYPSGAIPQLYEAMQGADMIVGARVGKTAKIPWSRRPAKWLIGKLANYLVEFKIPDINSGLRIMKKEVINKFLYILPDGFSFTTTITLAMLTNAHEVKYLPIAYEKRIGRSKFHPIKDTLNFIQLILKTMLYFNPLRIFMPLSFSLIFFAIAVAVLSRILTGRFMDVATAIFVMTAVMTMSVGMLAELINKKIK